MISRRALGTPLVLLVVAGVLLLALVSAGGSSAVQIGPGYVPGLGGLPETPPAEEGEAEPEVPIVVSVVAATGLALLLIVFVVLLVLGFIVLVGAITLQVRRRRRKRGASSVLPEDLESATDALPARVGELHRAARSALEQLHQRAGGDPGDAVIAAWLVLEREAARAGSARRAYQTPTEFTAAVLAEHRIDTAALDRLRALYQRARFGTRAAVTSADVAAAEEALRQVVDELAESTLAGSTLAGSTPAGSTPAGSTPAGGTR